MAVASPPVSLLDLPSELFLSITSRLPQKDLSSLSRTCKQLQYKVDPSLYASIHIQCYEQLPLLLQAIKKDPVRVSYLKALRLTGGTETHPHGDQATVSSLAQLFSYEFQKLRVLVVEGVYLEQKSLDDTLVDNLINQPALTQVSLWAANVNEDFYYDPFHIEELCLIFSPSLRRLTLHNYSLNLPLLLFDCPSPVRDFARHRPFHLRLWECDHDMVDLSRFLSLLGKVTKLSLYHPEYLYAPASAQKSDRAEHYVAVLEPIQDTLEELTLDYHRLWNAETRGPSPSFAAFSKLRYLRIASEFLKETVTCRHIQPERLAKRMPKKLRVLALEAPTLEQDPEDHDGEEHAGLIEGLLEHKMIVAPGLRELVLHLGEHETAPDRMREVAKSADVELKIGTWLSGLDAFDENW